MSKRIYRGKKQILLSISILVSGREETTGRCIASLDRLRSRVSCELILTDTGCPPEMRRQLEGKADKFFTFPWCDDFAAARNVGLRAASGKWFMFLDDDEWFEDTSGIEAFFLSGEYRGYRTASYVVRNYAEMDGSVWRDTPLNRMVRMQPDTRFYYPVHESLWPLTEPVKRLEDYAHHYGYASPDPEVQMAKRQRNLRLLLPEIDRDPHCMKHYLQAVSEYFSIDQHAAAWEMAERGLSHYSPARGDNAPHVDGLYAATVRMRLRAKRSGEAIRRGREHLAHAALSDLAKASISGDLAIAYGELEDWGEALRFLQEYLRWKDYFALRRDVWVEQVTLVLDSCFENFQYRKAMGWGFAAALSLGDAQSAEELLAREALEWWLDAVQAWYALASEEARGKWQSGFRCLCSPFPQPDRPGRQAGEWEEGPGPYGHLRQLYGILTVPDSQAALGRPSDEGAPDTSHGQGTVQEAADAQEAAAQMEILAARLKEKVRQLIGQGQEQAALSVMEQLRVYFPTDSELMELMERCRGQDRDC